MSCGDPATRSGTPPATRCWAHLTAARENRARPATSAMPSRGPASVTSRSECSSSGYPAMTGDGRTEWLATAERAVGLAKAAGATEVEALVTADDAQLTRFANSEIHQNVAETNVHLNLRVAIGKRIGVASTGRIDGEGLRQVAERAGAIARNVEELADWGGLPGPDGTPISPRPSPRRPRHSRPSSGPKALAPPSPPRTPPGRWRTARSPRRQSGSPSRTPTASGRSRNGLRRTSSPSRWAPTA